jgi:hypothetical protein
MVAKQRNWLWTINRRLRKLGHEIQVWPPRKSMFLISEEISRLCQNLEPELDTIDLKDLSMVMLGHSLILSKSKKSLSQLSQDAWIIGSTQGQGLGAFLEIGAYDPYQYSNTAILREVFLWKGFHVDPSERAKDAFLNIGLGDKFIHAAVGPKPGYGYLQGEDALAHISYSFEDLHLSVDHKVVPIVAPEQLIKRVGKVDYLSLDIEGGELEVLEAWPFTSSRPRYLTVEHNYRMKDRNRIQELLKGNGYRQVLGSFTDFEDWFVLDE